MVRQIFKPFQKAKDAKEFWDNAQEPQEGLVPLFNSPFYATPDEPADPMDCNRYPDSLYCGGNPFTNNFAPSIEVAMVRDECNLGLQLDASFAFIKFPPIQIVYRNPACIPPPPRPPEPPENSPLQVPPNYCGISDFLGIILYSYHLDEKTSSVDEKYIETSTEEVSLVSAFRPSDQYIYDDFLRRNVKIKAIVNLQYKIRASGNFRNPQNNYVYNLDRQPLFIITEEGSGIGNWLYKGQPILRHNITGIADLFFDYDTFADCASRIRNTRYREDYPGRSRDPIQIVQKKYELYVICGSSEHLLPPPLPRPMCCPNVQQNDQLLKLILKKIGSTQLPATVPKVLTNRQKGTIKIESLAEFTAYMVKQMDALCGRYPIDIEIEDADLTKEGNQTKKLKLPNIAETLAEMMGMLLVLRSESDATLNATIRALTEAGSSKQMAFLAYEYAKANAEFLGYKGEQKERKIPFAFKPGEARLDKMLVEGEISVKGWENEDKDDFNDLIAPLLELAAMWKVANYRKTGAGDPKESIKKFLKNAGKLSDDIDAGILLEKVKAYNAKDDKDKSPKDLKDDWDKFTEEAEKGFISQPGITDKENPYGRPLEERPRIRDISSDTSEEKEP